MTKMNRKATYMLIAAGWMAMQSSCIRVDCADCPPLSVEVVVNDKNYYNVNKVDLEDARPTNLPLRDYVPNLAYMLKNLKTGEVVVSEPLFNVPKATDSYGITFDPTMPYGTYVLTVWGGIHEGEEPLATDGQSLDLNPAGVEGGDPYLTCDTLLYDYPHSKHVVELERIKGKLLIQTVNLPTEAVTSTNTVDHLRNHVAADFRYSGQTTLSREATWPADAPVKVWKSILPPSTGDKQSVLSLRFRDASGNELPKLQPKDVGITMNRNGLTAVRYVWTWNDDSQQDGYWNIYVLINDNWELVHEMIVD